jgi:hypothetical protein
MEWLIGELVDWVNWLISELLIAYLPARRSCPKGVRPGRPNKFILAGRLVGRGVIDSFYL